jgi:ferritin-like metal-binding protein YciE
MTILSKRVQDLHSRYVENLRRTLDIEQKMISSPPLDLDRTTDRQLVDEFRSYMKQTEGHIARIECLLRRCSNRGTT